MSSKGFLAAGVASVGATISPGIKLLDTASNPLAIYFSLRCGRIVRIYRTSIIRDICINGSVIII